MNHFISWCGLSYVHYLCLLTMHTVVCSFCFPAGRDLHGEGKVGLNLSIITPLLNLQLPTLDFMNPTNDYW